MDLGKYEIHIRFFDQGCPIDHTLKCNSLFRNRQFREEKYFKGTKCPPKDMWDLPCLLQLLNWLHVSDYRNIWNNERWKSKLIFVVHSLASFDSFIYRNYFQNGAVDMSKMLKNA